MTTEQAEKPAGDNGSATVNHEPSPAPKQTEKPASGSWSVIVNHEPPVKQTEKTTGSHKTLKFKHEPTDKHTLTKHADKSIGNGKSIAIKPNPPAQTEPAVEFEQTAKPVAGGSWSVCVKQAPPAKRKTPVKMHRAATTRTYPDEETAREPVPVKNHKNGAIAIVFVIIAISAACVFATRQRSAKQTAAIRQTAQAYTVVTEFMTRMDGLKKQVPPSQRQLDEQIAVLQPITRASSINQDDSQRLKNAIQAVKIAEKTILDSETGEEQALLALEALGQHAEYKTLSEKTSASITEYKNLQKAVDAKCQALRSLIMAADQRITQLGGTTRK